MEAGPYPQHACTHRRSTNQLENASLGTQCRRGTQEARPADAPRDRKSPESHIKLPSKVRLITSVLLPRLDSFPAPEAHVLGWLSDEASPVLDS